MIWLQACVHVLRIGSPDREGYICAQCDWFHMAVHVWGVCAAGGVFASVHEPTPQGEAPAR